MPGIQKKRNSITERDRIKIDLVSSVNHSFSQNLTKEEAVITT
jgi:hypothetical protein